MCEIPFYLGTYFTYLHRLRPSVYGGLVPDAEKWELAGGWLAAIFRLYGAQLLTPTPTPDASPNPNPNPNPNPDPDPDPDQAHRC